MKVLILGSSGFIGKNFVRFAQDDNHEVVEVYETSEFEQNISDADLVIYCIGKNRVESDSEFELDFLMLVEYVEIINRSETKHGMKFCYLSSKKVETEPSLPFSVNKKRIEDHILSNQKEGTAYYIARPCNIIGAGCKPYYNSYITTLIHEAVNGIKTTTVCNGNNLVEFMHVRDLYDSILRSDEVMYSNEMPLFMIKTLIDQFKTGMYSQSCIIDGAKDLYSAYMSYVKPTDTIEPKQHTDVRGMFSTILEDQDLQISINTINEGQKKGGHYHHKKVEFFMLVSGKVKFIFEGNGKTEIIEPDLYKWYPVPVGMKHTVENTGKDTAKFLIWTNDKFNNKQPDTFR